MLTVLTWKWGKKYSRHHVRNLRVALARNLGVPHRFVCVSDDPGVDGYLPMPAAPRGSVREAIRLWAFSPEAASLGPRILNLDIDIVITGDITPLASRREPFIAWRSESFAPRGYALNPSLMLFDTGRFNSLWAAFAADAGGVLARARRMGFSGTEQAIIGAHFAGRDVPSWTAADGVISFRTMADPQILPGGTRLVSFHGKHDPAHCLIPWVIEHWHG